MNRHQIKKVDNSYFFTKVNLRIKHLPTKEDIKVLDCFAGKQKIWNEIKKRTKHKYNITSIDKKEGIGILRGDNIKYLKAMDINKYDLIDLDAYGIPFKQLEVIFKKQYKGKIFITFIQTMYGQLPKKMLNILGYSNSMIRKCPTLFNKNGIEKFKQYL